jgi:hypothetical protein
MLKINVSEEKNIDFEFELSGLSPYQIETRFRVMIDNIEYGFPAEVRTESIRVSIPPLKRMIIRDFKEGETFSARLEVNGDGHFLTPWEDHIKVHNPIKMEAKLNENEKQEDKDPPEIKVRVSEKANKKPRGGDVVTDNLKKAVKEKTEKVLKETKKVTEQNKNLTKPKPKMSFDEFKNMKKEDIMKYISRRATKNEQIQEMIYNQAVTAAGTGVPYKVFPKVMEILRRK